MLPHMHFMLYAAGTLQGRQPGAVRLRLKVEDPPGRRHMVFLGGSVLADIMKVRGGSGRCPAVTVMLQHRPH
jgi:hypothetical protein